MRRPAALQRWFPQSRNDCLFNLDKVFFDCRNPKEKIQYGRKASEVRMFCFKCGASMPDDSTVCPKCAAPVQAVPTPPPPPQQPSTPSPASTSAWLNVPAAPAQVPPQAQYPPQAQPYRGQYQPARTDGGAIASMVLGIASIALCLSFI